MVTSRQIRECLAEWCITARPVCINVSILQGNGCVLVMKGPPGRVYILIKYSALYIKDQFLTLNCQDLNLKPPGRTFAGL